MSEERRDNEDVEDLREEQEIAGGDLEPETVDQPTVKFDSVEDPGLPTSDPVFPTASPPLKPPVTSTEEPTVAAAPKPVEASSLPKPAPQSVPAGSPAAPTRAGSAVGPTRVGPTPRPRRSAEEIRADIEAGRQELSESVEVLRDRVNELTDWRSQIRKHRREITVAAAVVGFAVGARFMLRRRR